MAMTQRIGIATVALGIGGILSGPSVWAQLPPPSQGAEAGKSGRTTIEVTPEEEDFLPTPYTEFGEFNTDEEPERTRFFINGRHFAASLGGGIIQAAGNRGAIYQGGFPSLDLRVHYWFSYHSALDFGLNQSAFSYTQSGNQTDVSILNLGVNFKQYLNTTNLSSGISFANPYLLFGFGTYVKKEVNILANTETQPDTQLSPVLGAGVEFAIQARSLFLSLETKLHFPRFIDTTTTRFQPTVNDLSGFFYSFTTAILFVW